MDKRVPLGIIIAILIQTFALGAFITRMEGRISQLEVSDERLMIERDARRKLVDDKFEFLSAERTLTAQRMAKIEAQMDFLVAFARRAEQRWDREQGLPIQIPRNP